MHCRRFCADPESRQHAPPLRLCCQTITKLGNLAIHPLTFLSTLRDYFPCRQPHSMKWSLFPVNACWKMQLQTTIILSFYCACADDTDLVKSHPAEMMEILRSPSDVQPGRQLEVYRSLSTPDLLCLHLISISSRIRQSPSRCNSDRELLKTIPELWVQ
jgi:hypothetical protein